VEEILLDAGLEIVWFDSMGAKSSSIVVNTSDGCVLIDPGAAAMQPSYPLSSDLKRMYRRRAVEKIISYSKKCNVFIITHYHYDHHILPSDSDLGGFNIYAGKTLYVKDSNRYINLSQWRRARLFLSEILGIHGLSLEEYLTKPLQKRFRDPLDDLVYIHRRDYGEYSSRRRELLLKGSEWFRKLVSYWRTNKWVMEDIRLPDNIHILFADNREFSIGDVFFKIYPPWFHGVEYDKTGWVTPVLIDRRGYRIFYTSDLMGPIIEDYAYHISDLGLDIIIVDGPPTYLYPYMFNRVNLRRAIENMYVIIDSKPELIIYDHHLLRDPRWRRFVGEVLEYGEERNVKVLTAAEVLGDKPLIDKIIEGEHNV
jgi:predicted metallo-beta-lactamase superfamily hydrolase